MHEWFLENVGRTEKTRLKRNAGRNVRKLPMMVPLPSSDNSIGTHFVQNQSASPAFLIRHLPADKRKFCKDLDHRCLRSNATFPPGEGIRSIVQSAFFDTLKRTPITPDGGVSIAQCLSIHSPIRFCELELKKDIVRNKAE